MSTPATPIAIPAWYEDWPAFNQAHLLAQPLPVQKMMQLATPDERMAAAIPLAQAGYIIDDMIMVAGLSAWRLMSLRARYGYIYVPSLLQPNFANAPGGTPAIGSTGPFPNQTPIPPGSIIVITDITLLVPVAPPPPPTPPPPTPPAIFPPGAILQGGYVVLVGELIVGKTYKAGLGDTVPAQHQFDPPAPASTITWTDGKTYVKYGGGTMPFTWYVQQ